MAMTTPVCQFGWTAPDFHLEGVDGRWWNIEQLRGPKGLLVMFLCNHCPYVQAVIERIVRDVAELHEIGIGAAAVMSNDWQAYPEDSFDNMRIFARTHAFSFPYLIDPTQAVARAYDAVCTPDFFGFNAKLELHYRGRLDAAGNSRNAEGRRELFEAMCQIAESGQGPAEQTPSIGCSIKWRAGGWGR